MSASGHVHKNGVGKQAIEIQLGEKQVDWVDSMAKKHNLPDSSKSMRILLTFARALESTASILEEAQAQETIRSQSATSPSVLVVLTTYSVEDFVGATHLLLAEPEQITVKHVTFLEGMASKFEVGGISEAAQLIVDYIMSKCDDDEVYGVIRCKHGDTCSFCKK